MRIRVTITGREALDKGIWTQLCDLLGINEWAINEGLLDREEEIILTEDQARLLGLLPKKEE